MKTVGITGGTGAGKTTALRALSEMGAAVIDCDALYHRMLSESDELLSALAERFPEAFPEGRFDRKALGKIVFSDEAALRDLNAIAHPLIKKQVEGIIKSEQGREFFAIDAIALIEGGLSELCDVTVFVTAPADIRAERIMAREGISREYAELRISSQKDDEFFMENCTYTLVNDFDSEMCFKEHCIKFFENILGGP